MLEGIFIKIYISSNQKRYRKLLKLLLGTFCHHFRQLAHCYHTLHACQVVKVCNNRNNKTRFYSPAREMPHELPWNVWSLSCTQMLLALLCSNTSLLPSSVHEHALLKKKMHAHARLWDIKSHDRGGACCGYSPSEPPVIATQLILQNRFKFQL